jgi:t-SNARE complex subunit (syntaxin)
MSFQDVRTSRRETNTSSSTPRMRRNHPPKLPRVKAISLTPPATKPIRNRNRENSSNDGNTNSIPSSNKVLNRQPLSSTSLKNSLNNDFDGSYELKLSNSNSSYSESSLLDPNNESRDDYESFGPDRYQRQSSKSRNAPSLSEMDLSIEKIHRKSSSKFALLTYEMNQYQKLLSDLESIIKDSIVTPEVAWRTNILVKSVEETDFEVGEKLRNYETSLLQEQHQHQLLLFNSGKHVSNNDQRITQQQAACCKLQRDYNRCHRSMVSILDMYKARQKAEVSQLGAVQWNLVNSRGGATSNELGASLQQKQQPHMKEDYFDRVMRQKEVERMNKSMKHMNDIYHGLAGLVEGQQDTIDQLEGKIDYSKANVKAGYDEFSCYGRRNNGFLCGAMDSMDWKTENDYFEIDTRSMSLEKPSERLRINEKFYWSMPLETMKEDWLSARDDLVGLGRSFASSCKLLDWCTDE